MNICIYIDNSGIKDVDCRELTSGNPGIGGTEYCILLLTEIYKKSYPENKLCLIVSEQGKGTFPPVDSVIVEKDILNVPKRAKVCGAEILLISSLYRGAPLQDEFFENVMKEKIKTITWGHNFYLSDYCKRLARCEYVKANVFVGRQQYDRYIDHKVIRKSTYIYNMYPMGSNTKRNDQFRPVVTYIGSLVPAKGFQVLAAVWKDILQRVPEAELNVIGSGKLYSRNASLGTYCIADQAFEKQIMPGLTDEDGNILPSVHFLGVLGTEKNEVIKATSVGVVNPTGRTETFGISALDFESMGVPVVTIAKGGFLDTVRDKETGILVKKPPMIVDAITELLKDQKINKEYGQAGIELTKQFRPEKIIVQWNELFCKVCNDEKIDYIVPDSYMNTNLKWLRKFNRSIHSPFSIIAIETFARNILRRLGR